MRYVQHSRAGASTTGSHSSLLTFDTLYTSSCIPSLHAREHIDFTCSIDPPGPTRRNLTSVTPDGVSDNSAEHPSPLAAQRLHLEYVDIAIFLV